MEIAKLRSYVGTTHMGERAIVTVTIGLLDVFFTLFHYDGFGIISSRFYRLIWKALRFFSDPLPRPVSEFWRSLGTPLMIPATMFLWLGSAILGFAGIYYPFMHAKRPFHHACLCRGEC